MPTIRHPGKNLYANCLLALDANTGKLKWFHQLVHHDVWDLDMPTPPVLVNVHKDGRVIPAVLQTGKMSYVYYLTASRESRCTAWRSGP